MLEGGKISGRQLAFLLVLQVFGTVFLFLPGFVAKGAGRDAWLVPFVSAGFSLPQGALHLALVRRFQGATATGFCARQGGFLCRLPACLLLLFYTHLAAIVLREFGDFLNIAIMPETPLVVFGVVLVALSSYAVRQGIEVLGRLAEILLPVVLFSVAVVFILAVGNMDSRHFFPVLENGLLPLLKGSLPSFGWYSELAVLLFLAPFVARPEETGWSFSVAVVITSIFFLLVIAGPLAVFGAEVTKSLVFPTFSLARIVELAEIVSRIEVVVVAVWVTAALVKLGILHYILVLGSAELLGLRDYRTLVLPLGLILGALSILVSRNVVELTEFLNRTWFFYSVTLQFLLPFAFFLMPLPGGNRR